MAQTEPVFEHLKRRDYNSVRQWAADHGRQTHVCYNADGLTPLHIAAEAGDLQALEALLPVETVNALSLRFATTPLIHASMNGHLPFVRRLVELGAQITYTDATQHTARFYAQHLGHWDVAEFLATKEPVDVLDSVSRWLGALVSPPERRQVQTQKRHVGRLNENL
eukprot:TRINITY_DN1667_c0_g1_i1.p2 TRINITY_DN1667_c0_g1~~TRINITY_DN1667_c0_g1_i1.p2  ORF type:complete len:166 (-),score=29.69 TRINITY_DN1667_c0_g1_i1:917-1414(-)